MGSSITSVSLNSAGGFFAPAWLPPGGHGNGLDAPAWAPIADLDADLAEQVLALFAERSVPGYLAPRPDGARSRMRPPCGRRRLWVATGSYTRAQDLLVEHLPSLLRARAHG